MTIAEVTPPLFAFGLCRVDSAAKNTGLPHFTDAKFFRDHPKRRAYLRVCWKDEFDKHIPDKYIAALPRMHALVTKLSDGTHFLVPVFRTNHPFWTEPRTDAEVASIVTEMGRRGGMDEVEMIQYAAERCTDDLDEIVAGFKPTVVH